MGLLGGDSKSSSKTNVSPSQSTANADNGSTSTSASIGSVTAGKNGSNFDSITTLDADVANNAITVSAELGKQALALSGETIAGAYELFDRQAAITEASRIGNENLARDTVQTLASKLERNTQNDAVTLLQTVGKYAAVSILGLVLLFLFFRRKSAS